jgi:hypothetical protein
VIHNKYVLIPAIESTCSPSAAETESSADEPASLERRTLRPSARSTGLQDGNYHRADKPVLRGWAGYFNLIQGKRAGDTGWLGAPQISLCNLASIRLLLDLVA